MSRRAVVLLVVLLLLVAAGIGAAVSSGASRDEAASGRTGAAVPAVAAATEAAHPSRAERAPPRVETAAPAPETPRRPFRVVVRRADDGLVPGARVVLLAPPERFGRLVANAEIARATTDASGVASFADVPGAPLVFASTAGECGLWFSEFFTASGEWAERECTVRLLASRAADVEVVDGADRPVAGAAVFALVNIWNGSLSIIRTRDGAYESANPAATFAARTDSAGRCSFAGFPPDEWAPDGLLVSRADTPSLFVEAAGFRTAHQRLVTGRNRIVLVPAAECRALVVDEQGRPIGGAAWTAGAECRGWGGSDGQLVALVPDGGERRLTIDADGFLPRTIELTARAPDVVELGNVVLLPTPMLRGTVFHSHGAPAGGVLVTATLESAERAIVQDLTSADGTFALEPPREGAYRITAGTRGGPQRGARRDSLWEAIAEHVRIGAETRLELRFVPAMVVELVAPSPKPAEFGMDNVSIIPRSSDGRGEYEWEPESHGRYLVHLYGRGPWKVEIRQSAIEPVDFEVAAAPGPDDEVLYRKIELRAAK